MRKLAILGLLLAATAANAEKPVNFIAYDEGFASSGQPTAEQIEALSYQGYERIVYLAFGDHDTSLANEDRIARNHGFDYVQLPVIWDKPSYHDFRTFAAIMQSSDKNTLVHCQVNYRASTFSMLYRIIHQGVDVGDAKDDMNQVWQPTEAWRNFIFSVLARHGIDAACEACDWTPWVPEGNKED